MNKKLLMVAVGAALAAPMMAATAAPTVYGKFHMSLDRTDSGAATGNENGYISNNTSRFGIKGTDDLGGGMKATYGVEIPFQADGETGSGSTSTATSSTGVVTTNIATRATYVGLDGGFGSVKVGKLDMFMKSYGRSVDLFNERAGDSRNVYSGSMATEGSFLNNAIQYSSPKIAGGLTVDVSYATGENNSSPSQAVVSAVGVKWASGPLMVGVVQGENHGGGTNAESQTRIVASYKAGAFGVYFMNATQDNVGSSGTTANIDRTVMGIGASFAMGNSTFKLQSYTADKFDNATTANGGGVLALGVDHALSKTTTAYFAYAKSDNDAGAAFSPAGAGHGDAPTTATGKSGTVLSVGMELLF